MKRSLPILLLLFLLPLRATAYEYAPGADVSFRAPFAEETVSSAPGFAYRSARADYRFSPDIDQPTRDALIDVQEALLSTLNAEGLTVYVAPDIAPRAESARKAIFLAPAEDGGLTQAVVTLLALQGETTPYGLVFGAADALCRAAGLPGYTLRFNEKGMLRFYNTEGNLPHFLLTYPSFTEDYTDKSVIPFVKDLAVRFFAFAEERGQARTLLTEQDAEAFQAAFLPLMNEFLAAQKAETGLHGYLPALRFGFGGEACPLILSSRHGLWYLLSDFSLWPGYGQGMSFSALYTAMWQAEDDLSHVDECLKLPQTDLTFLLCAPGAHGLTTNYQHGAAGGPVTLSTLDSLVHEYVHACVAQRHTGENAWFLTELAATYFEMQGQHNAHDNLYFTLYDLRGEAQEYWAPVLDALEAGDRLSDWPDAREIYDYLCFSREQYDLFTPGARTLNGLRSFSCYLRDQFGDEKVGAALRQGEAEEALGKDWDALRQDWQRHLQGLYGRNAAL